MTESAVPTDFQRAANVARYVQIENVSLNESHARLCVPREIALSKPAVKVKIEKSAKHSFTEDSKALVVDILFSSQLVPDGEAEELALVEVSCQFALEYRFDVKGGPEGEERGRYLQAFAEINGMYNAWPYFRELFQSSISRMGLPPIALPLYRAGK